MSLLYFGRAEIKNKKGEIATNNPIIDDSTIKQTSISGNNYIVNGNVKKHIHYHKQ